MQVGFFSPTPLIIAGKILTSHKMTPPILISIIKNYLKRYQMNKVVYLSNNAQIPI